MLLLAAALTLGVAAALAAPGPPAYYSPSTKCYTTYATTRCAPPKTTYQTHYTSCTRTSTITSSTTVTPPTQTITSVTTTTSTTVSTAPSTVLTSTTTTTQTVDSTTTETTTSTSVSTSTSTSTASTTVSAPAGFTPVQSSLPGSSYQGRGGQPPVNKRGRIARELDVEARDALKVDVSLNLFTHWWGHRWPKKVHCHKYSPSPKCTTVRQTKTSTVTASTPSTTITRTSTVTSTSTVVPSATTTSTVTSTSTRVSTETSTSTVTSTTTTSTATTTSLYAACATPNLADTFDNQQFNSYSTFSGTSGFVSTGSNTAYDCCVDAITLDPNAGTAIAFLQNLSRGGCLISVNNQQNTCPANGQQQNTAVVGYGSTEDKYVIGNGLCGEIIEARQA